MRNSRRALPRTGIVGVMGIELYLWRDRPQGLGGPQLYEGTSEEVRQRVDAYVAEHVRAHADGRLLVVEGTTWDAAMTLVAGGGWCPKDAKPLLTMSAAGLETIAPITVPDHDATALAAALDLAVAASQAELGLTGRQDPEASSVTPGWEGWVGESWDSDALTIVADRYAAVVAIRKFTKRGGFDLY